MKKKFIKIIFLTFTIFSIVIIYLSIFGLETERFNKQIINKIKQTNNKLDLKLKKVKLTLDPLDFKINAKTIGSKLTYQNKTLDLEYIKTKVSLISIIKNKFASSSLEISTKSLLLRDLVTFTRVTTNRSELFILEKMINGGYVILDVDLNFDENGNIKDDYGVRAILKDGRVNYLKKYNFEKINLILNIRNNILNFKDIKFTANKMNFISNNFKVTKSKKDFIFEGLLENKNTDLNYDLRKLIGLNFENVNFSSKNNFSFKINNNFKFKNLNLESEINVNKFNYKRPDIISKFFPKIDDIINFKSHKIKAKYKNNNYSIEGIGKIKFQDEFDEIEYFINNKNNDFNLTSKIDLNELAFKNQEFFKNFFPKINDEIILKKHQIEVNLNNDDLLFKGSGGIKLEKEFDKIDYSISKIGKKYNFDTKLNLNKTLLKVDYLNFKKNIDLDTKVEVIGNYEDNRDLNLDKISILDKNSQIILSNLVLDNKKSLKKIDKIDLNYIDFENKKNQFHIRRIKKNDYELIGSILNANNLITNLLESKKSKKKIKIFKNNIDIRLNLSRVSIDNETIVKNLKGNLRIENDKIIKTNISALFNENENLTFTINTNNNEKITTLFSSRARPLVRRYKFIKGYEEGYLDFYSSKRGNISTSTLKIYDFKLQKLPALTKLLTLASLQGIADTLSGEGIRFNEFEMNFQNKNNLMTIDEIYAIGPAISILMSGYVEQDKLVSLRGTLVPATTINKSISNIPFLGKILVGDKTGEGVFGVSFKIKGPPKNLETTVNPIKTLTPRFITRTLEKIKKN